MSITGTMVWQALIVCHSNVAQAMYSEIPGAILTNLSDFGDIWVLPCDQQVNATFLFGGVEFPIHPLDLNFDGFDLETDGLAYCVGAVSAFPLCLSTICQFPISSSHTHSTSRRMVKFSLT